MTADDIIAEIEDARPPHYFDAVRGLLRQYAALRVQIGDLWRRLHKTRPGWAQSTALTAQVCAKMAAAREFADALHLLDRSLPPPRLQ